MSASAAPNRYASRPFLRFLDCYVLDAIEQLDDGQREALERMEPKLRDVFDGEGTWQQIVEAQMDFPSSLPDQIRAVWAGYLNQARRAGQSVSPNEFVLEFVRENFPDLSGGASEVAL